MTAKLAISVLLDETFEIFCPQKSIKINYKNCGLDGIDISVLQK